MRICFFNDISFLGGGEYWVLRACHYLNSRGHEASVICPHPTALQAACLREGIDVFGYSLHLGAGYPLYEAIYHYLKEREVDVIYCTVMGRFCEAGMLEKIVDRLNTESGSAIAIILKTGLPPMEDVSPEYYGAGAGRSVRRLHVVSKSLKDAFVDWYPAMNNGFMKVFYEGADLQRFCRNGHDKEESRRRWNIPVGHTVVTCVARLDGMKGQSVLVRAIPEIIKKYPGTVFMIAGEGRDRDMLEVLRDDLGLEQHVRLLGKVDDVPSLLHATDILCHPSLNDGLPNSIIEAMAMSIPVVASDLPGIREVITDGKTGFLVRPNDVGRLTKALLEALNDEGRSAAIGAGAGKVISTHFDFNVNMERLLASLEAEVLQLRRSPGRKTVPKSPDSNICVNVLFIMSEIRLGGEETELGILCRYLDQKRYRMSVLSCNASVEYSPVLQKLGYYNIPIDTACHQITNLTAKVYYIVEKIRREDIGIIVACQNTSLAYHVAKEFLPHECRFIEHGGILSEALLNPKDLTARYIGVSREITNAAATQMKDPAHAVFIPSMVDTDEYDNPEYEYPRSLTKQSIRETVLQPFGYPEDACLVTFVGRLDPKKHVEDLLMAARTIVCESPEVLFMVVGGNDAFAPQYGQDLIECNYDLISKGRLAFTGTRSDVTGILCASDILVLPSTGEGMAHVINEAGAAGIAVIATDDGAAREQLEDGACGILITPRSVEELTAALRKLIKDRQLRRELGSRLKERVRSHYSASVVIEQWHSLLRDVAGELKKPARIRVVRDDEVLPFPLEIQIQTTTACNASCIMCPHPVVSKEVSMGHMSEDLYKHILDECAEEPGLRRLEPFLMAEPFVDKRMVDLIALSKQRVPHANLTVTTNGSLVTPAVSDRLIQSGLDAIWFSFNGATSETYEKIMGIKHKTVMDNIQYLLAVKPASLKVFVNMIETKPMKDEIETNISYWKKQGVEAGPSPLVNRGGNVENYDELNYKPVSKKPIRVCDLVYHKMYILYNGDVVLCCMDWRRQVVLGNVKEQSIRDIWLGDRYQHIRGKLVQRKVCDLELCSTCSYTYT